MQHGEISLPAFEKLIKQDIFCENITEIDSVRFKTSILFSKYLMFSLTIRFSLHLRVYESAKLGRVAFFKVQI